MNLSEVKELVIPPIWDIIMDYASPDYVSMFDLVIRDIAQWKSPLFKSYIHKSESHFKSLDLTQFKIVDAYDDVIYDITLMWENYNKLVD